MMRAHRRASRGPAAARHGRGHLAHHHLDLHLCAVALQRACRRLARRGGDARFGALPFRLHRALRAAYERGGGDRRGGARDGDLGMFALDGGAAAGAWWMRPGRARRAQGDRPAAVRRAARPSRRACRCFVIAKPLADGRRARCRARSGGARPLARRLSRRRSRRSAARSSATPPTASGLSLLVARPGGLREGAAATALRQGGRGRRAQRRNRRPRGALRRVEVAPARRLGGNEGTMSASKPLRPQPRAEIMAIDAYVPGKSARRRARQGPQAVVERIAARPLAARDRGVSRQRRASSPLYPDGSSRAAARGDRPALRARPRADHLRQRLGRTARAARPCLSLARRRRALQPISASSNIRSRFAPPAATPVVARGDATTTADVDALLAQGDAAHQDRLSRQSQQSDRHLSAVRRGQAPARRPAGRRAARARRRLCRICRAQRLRGRRRTRRDVRERRDDAHLLENLRPRQSAHRLGLCAGARSSTRSTACAAPFNVNGAAIAAGVAAIADAAHVDAAVAHNDALAAAGSREEIRRARASR